MGDAGEPGGAGMEGFSKVYLPGPSLGTGVRNGGLANAR